VLNETELKIENEYKSLFHDEGAPEWAKNIEPAIPWVGKRYSHSSVKILIYGSAENLTYASGQTITKNNFRRNREVSDNSKYFKHIHITPINDGSLLTVARYVLSRLGHDKKFSENPREFIEEVSVVNLCKFSIDSKKNKDYANKLSYLKKSFSYIKKELEILDPDIIIIPSSSYKLATLKKELFVKKRIMIPIYQTNLRVINSHLNKTPVNDKVYNYSFSKEWLDKGIKGMPKYLSWLEEKMQITQVLNN